MRPISFNHESKRWQPKFNVPFQGFTFNVVAPFDFATIYNLLPLWNQGFTGKGVTIALVEDSNLANPKDWSTFRKDFWLERIHTRQLQTGISELPQSRSERR